MIITRLNGGLGNQLFQYAISLAIIKKNKTELYLDLSAYSRFLSRNTPRNFLLNRLFPTKNKPNLFLDLFFIKFNLVNRLFVVREKKIFTFDSSILEKKSLVILDGYWQSYKYFEPIRTELQKLYLTPKKLNQKNRDMLNLIKKFHSVCVHIRRGDYINNPHANNFHGVLSLNYYNNALKLLKKSVPNAHLFIFSDDVEWVRLNFKPNLPYTIVDINDDSKPYFDLWLMGHCKYFIIANSTLSWWAAYLSKFNNKIVIAPKYWLRHLKSVDTDLIPPEWKLVSN